MLKVIHKLLYIYNTLYTPTWSIRYVYNHGRTFADFQVYGVVNVLDEFLTSTSFLEHEPLEVQNKYRRQLFQGHSPADFNLSRERKRSKCHLTIHANPHQKVTS